MIYTNRQNAGHVLAKKLHHLKGLENLLVFGLPRGGVPVAAEVARALDAPLDVIICRKIGAPGNPEFAIGAISESGGEFLNDEVIESYQISQEYIKNTIAMEQKKINTYKEAFRDGKNLPSLQEKIVVLIDDGAATGMTLKAAIDATRKQGCQKIIVALPVAPSDATQELESLADECIILETPPHFQAVGQFYDNFQQIETEEAKKILKKYCQ